MSSLIQMQVCRITLELKPRARIEPPQGKQRIFGRHAPAARVQWVVGWRQSNICVRSEEFDAQTRGANVHIQIRVSHEDFAQVTQDSPVRTFVECFSAEKLQRRLTSRAIFRSVLLARGPLLFS